jgi:hypothetical protein
MKYVEEYKHGHDIEIFYYGVSIETDHLELTRVTAYDGDITGDVDDNIGKKLGMASMSVAQIR